MNGPAKPLAPTGPGRNLLPQRRGLTPRESNASSHPFRLCPVVRRRLAGSSPYAANEIYWDSHRWLAAGIGS